MIIDTHVHIGGESVGFEMKEDMVIEAMNKYGINFAIVSNAQAVEADHNQNILPPGLQISQEKALEKSLKFARKNKGKIGIALWIKPCTQKITKELKDLLLQNKDIICALKIHPYHSHISPMDERVFPYIELAEMLNLPVISHTGNNADDAVIHLYELAKMFPKVSFIMAHMGLGTDNKEALELLGKADNLYGDTTWVPMSTTLKAIEMYGSKRIMFGSDMPIDGVDTYAQNPKGERSLYQDYFNELPRVISSEAYQDIMYKNALRVFNLDINID